jgi:hypothetical protein
LRAVAVVAFVAFVLAGAGASAQIINDREPWRPPALEASPSCDVFSGSGHGNDPTLLVEMRLCKEEREGATAVTGRAQYSGLQSGWSVRTLAGSCTDDCSAIDVHEDAIIEQKPNPGWRFCTVDRYRLTRDKATSALVGSYDSAACRDHGELTMKLTGRVDAPRNKANDGDRREARLVPSAVPPTLPGRKSPDGKSACGCRMAGAPGWGAWGEAVAAPSALAAIAAWVRRRRRA